jgi:DNA-binding response OmpR family regulator
MEKAMARILVVEDDHPTADLLSEWLKAAGYDVIGPVPRLDAALGNLADFGADAVLLDINLGGAPKGLGLAEILDAQRIPFCFITAYSPYLLPVGLRDRPRLEKPFERQRVLAVVAQLLEGRRSSVE